MLGIAKISAQMKEILIGKTIKNFELTQKRALNVAAGDFLKRTKEASISDIYHVGKWLVMSLDNNENLLLSFTLGSDILYFENNDIKQGKYPPNAKVFFADGSGFSVRFWWFESFFVLHETEIAETINAANIIMDPLDEAFTLDFFASVLKGKKTQIKNFLMTQKKIAGLSGMYMHDILFSAGLHPLKSITEMNGEDIGRLHGSIVKTVANFRRKMCFFGENGRFEGDDFAVAYKDDGQPCPICTQPIAYIKTGSTSTYICPNCQKL